MDITVYLPDDVGRRAKEAELPLSQMLRAAVLTELERREAMETAIEGSKEIVLDLENENGNRYKGRFTGKYLAESGDCQVYVTDDTRLIVYDANKLRYYEYDAEDEDAVAEAVGDLGTDTCAEVMGALGFEYTVDI